MPACMYWEQKTYRLNRLWVRLAIERWRLCDTNRISLRRGCREGFVRRREGRSDRRHRADGGGRGGVDGGGRAWRGDDGGDGGGDGGGDDGSGVEGEEEWEMELWSVWGDYAAY